MKRPPASVILFVAIVAAVTLWIGSGIATREPPAPEAEAARPNVRDAVEIARADLPAGAEEPTITEFDISLLPVVTVALSGNVAERALLSIARDLRARIEGLPGGARGRPRGRPRGPDGDPRRSDRGRVLPDILRPGRGRERRRGRQSSD